MERGYQYGFSDSEAGVFDVVGRERKAKTMTSILSDYFKRPLGDLALLDVGASTGIIDNYLAQSFGNVTGLDIDEAAIKYAKQTHHKSNLTFYVADAMKLPFSQPCFDVVICSHVYEHVPDARQMFDEIFRVLKPGGICYFAAGNRLMWNEPHHNLPLLSVLPRPLAHVYMRLSGKGKYYYEKHLSYWGLKSLIVGYQYEDYTLKLVSQPEKFHIDYMLSPTSIKAKIAKTVLSYFKWLSPGYIWLVKKE